MWRGLEVSAPAPFDALEAYHREVAEKTQSLLASLNSEALEEEVVFKWGKGSLKSSVENVLLHTFVDEVAHVGELVGLMWQMDVEPPQLNWLDLPTRVRNRGTTEDSGGPTTPTRIWSESGPDPFSPVIESGGR